jgi:2-C-methyl-D-erythritol 4-phosphate cytidylyltransferase
MKTTAIIVAAGKSKRIGTKINKPYLKLDKNTILWHTLKKFEEHNLISSIILVIQKKDEKKCKKIIKKFRKVFHIAYGGKERSDSVYNGLKYVQTPLVLIHDANRPFVAKEYITKVIKVARKTGACTLAIPVYDTVRKNNKTLDRKGMYLVQTPQAFHTNILLKAYKNKYEKGIHSTDDASLVEKIRKKVNIVEGSPLNIKITTKKDLTLARKLVKTL